jgi:signal transduction histidine kinase/CheY-like chemotaxis protein
LLPFPTEINFMTVSPTPHILCIEDAPGEARLIERQLRRNGYEVTLAHDGEYGLVLQKQTDFNAALIDLNLPGITGLDTLRTILERDPLLPVIMVTGRGDEETAVTAMKLGARDYIVKDAHGGFIELLPAVLDQVIRQQHLVLEKQRAEQITQRREAILESVAFAAEKLLQTPAWNNNIQEILARLGQATEVSRVYLAENGKTADNRFIIKHCHEWLADNIPYRTLACTGKTYDEIGLTDWITLFEHGQPAYGLVQNLSPSMQANLDKHGVQSVIIVPIFTGSSWWGFIGFDDCLREHLWETAEIDALRTAANILGAALQRQQTEATLYQAQKLESIGVLAGGVAHDFNNLLTGILSQTSLALLKLPDDTPARDNLDKAIQTTEQAALLVRQLLGYAGKGNYQIQPLNLNALIRDNMGLLETILRKQAQLHLDLAPNLPTVEADRSQMQQIVMNLVINAAEAIEESGGTVRIVTQLVEADTAVPGIAQTPLPPGQYVRFDVIDSGCGITPATMNRIFDPFFSTKTNGHGLGLSAALGIIQAHGGALQVESQVGQGSHFRVFLPASTQAETAPPTTSRLNGRLQGCILVIDDEPVVRQVVKEGLETLGAQVLTAENGPAGIELYRQHHQTIDVVLLDMIMPGMNGRQTFPHLQNINPHLKVILSSGYSEGETVQAFGSQDILIFLQKPYRFEKLATLIQTALMPDE